MDLQCQRLFRKLVPLDHQTPCVTFCSPAPFLQGMTKPSLPAQVQETPCSPHQGWAPQKSSGGTLFIHEGIRHCVPATTTSDSTRLGAHLPSEARLNSETSSSVLV